MKKILFALISLVLANAAFAEQVFPGEELIRRQQSWMQTNEVLVAVLMIATMVMLVFLIVLLIIALNRIKALKAEASAGPVIKWWHVFGNKDQVKDEYMEGHEHDGIVEYNNNPPSWFNWLFYLSVLWGVAYLLYFHVFQIGDLQEERYAKQMKEAEVLIAKAQEKAIKLADQPPYSDEDHLTLGKAAYLTNCQQCHGDQGQGVVGPNLTDEYWIHGGKYRDVFTTIFNGVPEKGMISWKKALKPDQIRAIASYVYSLKGTNPPNPKAPEGQKVTETASEDSRQAAL